MSKCDKVSPKLGTREWSDRLQTDHYLVDVGKISSAPPALRSAPVGCISKKSAKLSALRMRGDVLVGVEEAAQLHTLSIGR